MRRVTSDVVRGGRPSYVGHPVLCVSLNGQFLQIFAPRTSAIGCFLDVIQVNIKRYENHRVGHIARRDW